MKILKTSDINNSNAMPVKSGTLDFIQQSHKETVAGLFSNLVPNPDANTIYVVSGCINLDNLPAHNITSGILFYNGEIFEFDGAVFTLTGLQKAYAKIETTQYTTNADPVQFTDGVSRNVHNIRKIVIQNTITSSGLPEFKDFINVGAWLKGDTKEVVCDSTYLNTNFDSTGLGRGERKGWAIMNGQNGTQNDNGKVVIAYGSTYNTLEAIGGSADAVLVSHSHKFEMSGDDNDSKAGQLITTNTVENLGFNGQGYTYKSLSTEGESGVGKNMQPYVVRLRIQKI